MSPPTSFASPKYYVPDNARSPTSISSWGTLHTQHPSTHAPHFQASYTGPSGSLPNSNIPLLHPTLQPPSPLPFDIRSPPGPISGPAFQPNLTRTRISVLGHPGWIFEVKNPSGITVQDILNTIYCHFQLPIHHAAYSTLPAEVVFNSEDHFRRRVGGNRADYNAGLKRLDCLCFQFRFVGLTPSNSHPGVWNLHLA